MTRDSVTGLVCLTISVVLLIMTRGLPRSELVPIGPDFYPRILLGLTAVMSVALIGMDIVRARLGREPRVPAGARNHLLVLSTFVAFLLYIVAIQFLGFRIATFAFVAVLQPLLESPQGVPGWLRVILVAALTSIVCFVVFEQYLLVLMPRGSLTGL
jgi:putative tricarboxylic transport membrane protein